MLNWDGLSHECPIEVNLINTSSNRWGCHRCGGGSSVSRNGYHRKTCWFRNCRRYGDDCSRVHLGCRTIPDNGSPEPCGNKWIPSFAPIFRMMREVETKHIAHAWSAVTIVWYGGSDVCDFTLNRSRESYVKSTYRSICEHIWYHPWRTILDQQWQDELMCPTLGFEPDESGTKG